MGLISSIASVVNPESGKATARAYLAELDATGNVDPNDAYEFQYFPETISDQRDVPLETKQALGSSHPIYQWVHGGERKISFQAIFTSDEDYGPILESRTSTALNIASRATSLLKDPLQSIGSALIKNQNSDPYSVSVSAAIAWLRSKTYPLYTSGNVQAPPKLCLWLENSGITSFVNSSFQVSTVPVLMTSCNVEYEAFFRSGAPRIVVVSLDFVEIVQVSKNWRFVSRKDLYKAYKQTAVGSATDALRYGKKALSGPPSKVLQEPKSGPESNPVSGPISTVKGFLGL